MKESRHEEANYHDYIHCLGRKLIYTCIYTISHVNGSLAQTFLSGILGRNDRVDIVQGRVMTHV